MSPFSQMPAHCLVPVRCFYLLVAYRFYFRCVKAVSDVVKDLPLLTFKIVLDDAAGYFVASEGFDINALVAIINGMGDKFTASLKAI